MDYELPTRKQMFTQIPLIFAAVAIVMMTYLYWNAHTAPYWVYLNPETDYGGTVYLYSTMNYHSRSYIEIPTETQCVRLDNNTYTIEFDPPLNFYKLNCRGANGFVQTNKVLLP